MGANPNPTYVELTFCPSLELIPVVRRFVSGFYGRLLAEEDVASRMALATHELLENSVKFSSDGVASLHIGVTTGPAAEVTIRTLNRAAETDRDAALRLVEELRAAPDPLDFYQEVMRRNAHRRDGSGLGLARIRAEAEMTIDCSVADDQVCVTARTIVTRPAGAAQP